MGSRSVDACPHPEKEAHKLTEVLNDAQGEIAMDRSHRASTSALASSQEAGAGQ